MGHRRDPRPGASRAAAVIGLLVAAALPFAPVVVAQEDVTTGFPASLGGQPLEVQTFTGPEWLARVDPATEDGARVTERTQTLVAASGGSIDDLSVATALHEPSPGNHAAITAVRVTGATATDLVMPAIGLLLGDITDPALRLRNVSGRDVLRVTDAAVPGTYPRTVYAAGDTVWVVEAEGEPMAEILAALPPREGPPAPDTSALAADFPGRLGGQRPSELYLATGWGGPISPALGAMFGPESEEVAVRLFLEQGVTLEDLTWAYGIWSDGEDASTVLAAFRIAGLDPATMQGVLEGVVVPSFSGGFQQPAQATSEVSGRSMVTLRDDALPEEDRASDTYHFVVGGDTIWMVNVPSADEALVAEAIGQLPA
jgi:hypothetical protein